MKLVLFAGLLIAMVTPSVFADVCYNDNITIKENPVGTFTVLPPDGYSFVGEHMKITKTGQTSFIEAEVTGGNGSSSIPLKGPYLNFTTSRDMWCFYQIAQSGGIFILSKNNTAGKTFNLGNDWYSLSAPNPGLPYECDGGDCSFSPTK